MLAQMDPMPTTPSRSAAQRPGRGGAPSSPAWRVPALLALLLLLGWLVYRPGLRGGFVFDDFSNIVQQPAFAPQALKAHFWAAVWAGRAGPLSRALSMLSFAWQIRHWGMSPQPMKVFNLLLHLGNGLLVAGLSLRVLRWVDERQREHGRGAGASWVLSPTLLGLLVAAAWLLAPIQVTAVLYVVQREESLAAGLVLLGLLGYWHGRMRLRRAVQTGGSRRAAWLWIWGSLAGGTALAALAKETGVLLPAYAAVLEWVVLRGDCAARPGSVEHRQLRCSLLGVYGVLLLLPGLLGLAWLLPGILHGAYAQRDFTLGQRLLTEGRVMVDYLHWILLPTPQQLSLYHDDIGVSTSWLHPWSTAACWALLLALLLAGLALRRRAPVVSLGILWFFVGQSLVSTIVPLELVYEHRNYLPSWGVLMAAFGLLGAWAPRRRGSWPVLAATLCAALVALYAGFTLLRASIWSNPYRLAYFEATTHPRSPRANYGLGRVLYLMAGGPQSASFQFATRQMQVAAGLPGADMQPLQALVFMHAKFGLPVDPAWWAALNRDLLRQRLSAENISSLYSLVQCATDGICHYAATDRAQLAALLDAGVREHPGSAELHTLRANFEANVAHNYPAAYQDMLRAVALDPSGLHYWANLVQLQIAGGQWPEAARGLERMAELDPFGLHRASRAALSRKLRQARDASGARP